NGLAVPFSYFNDAGALVGYDVEFAYDLARSLNVRLIFVPFEWSALERDLRDGRFDIAMAGIYASTQRLSSLSASASYYQSPIALFMPSDRARRGLRIAMSVDPVLHPLWTRLFPNAEIVMVPDYRTPPDFSKVDAAIWTLEQAA